MRSYTGNQPFGPLSLVVRAPVLIPRSETEAWALYAAGLLAERMLRGTSLRILDLCTGSGCIALLLAHHLRGYADWHIDAVDCDAASLSVARENVARCGWEGDGRVRAVQGDVLDEVCAAEMCRKPYDVVVGNPPYIASDVFDRLDLSVRAYESRTALVGHAGDDGLGYYRRVAALVRRGLVRRGAGPRVVLEVGAGQARDVSALLAPLGDIATWNDDLGHERVVALM